MSSLGIVRATMLASTVLWACVEVLKVRRPYAVEPARSMWTAAAGLALLHAVTAFHVTYDWSHQAALEDTARRTAAATGLAWGGGIFVNYVFLAVWAADAIWWWVAPATYMGRAAIINRIRAGFFIFMFLNGAVVFASNTARVVGIPAVATACLTWLLDARTRPLRG